jgi:hypothetical protein
METNPAARSASLVGRRRTLLFCAVSLLIGCSFFVRHITGMLYAHFQYSCLVYNPKSVRENPPANYDFMPEDVSWDETRWYGRWTNEVLRGEWSGANLESYSAFLTSPVPRQPLWLRDRMGPLILAGIARLPGSDVRTAFLAADLLFPTGVALSLMFLSWELRPSTSFAVAATSLIMFFNWQDVLNFIALLRGARQNSATFLRTPYPQLSMILFALFLLSLVRMLRKSTTSVCLWFGILLTLNLLTYFYSWTYAFMFIGATGLLLLIAALLPSVGLPIPSIKNSRYIFVALVGGTIVSLLLTFPVWAGIVTKNPVVHAAFIRGSGKLGHRPELKYSSLLLVLLILLLLWRSCRWANRWFAVVYLSGSLLVMNIQVITGKTIQPEHWAAYYIQPLFLLFLIDFLWTLKGRNHRILWRMVAVILLAAGILTSVYKLSIGARQAIDFNRRDPAFEQLLSLLQQPWLRDYGFLSNDEYVNSVLPAFVIQKPLWPLYHDPLTDAELASLEMSSERALESGSIPKLVSHSQTPSGPMTPAPVFTFKTERIIFVLNRHLFFSHSLLTNRRVLLQNQDFLVLTTAAAP